MSGLPVSEQQARDGRTPREPGAGQPVLEVGDEIELDIGAVAHGGLCVARADGRVVFVRYALPGERALVRITEAKSGSYCRGEAITVLRADPRRVTPLCVHFGPGGCGGCDWQHASAELQRELAASVISEQLRRGAGVEIPVVVEPLPGDRFGWRTRVRWAVDAVGRQVGPRRYRSHDVVAVTGDRPCVIAAPELSEAAAVLAETVGTSAAGDLAGAQELVLVDRGTAPPIVTRAESDTGARAAVAGRQGGHAGPTGRTDPALRLVVAELVGDRTFATDAVGFWQAHRAAAETLTVAVAQALAGVGVDVTGGVAWDLYGGVGLFAPVLATSVGSSGQVITVESDRSASAHAAANLADLQQVSAICARVDQFVAADQGALDIALLDPPRTGAGAAVCRALAQRTPAAIVYVACDPAALARDAATLRDAGYCLKSLRAFDAFPQTHHVECVAVFVPAD